jgi:predicted TIM-barrel enzyme
MTHKIYPVIHVESEDQAIRNLEVAMIAGADGVFLINHEIDAADLAIILRNVRRRYSDTWVGVNYLDVGWPVAQKLAANAADALWMDRCVGVSDWVLKTPIFMGLAFKYQIQGSLVEETSRVMTLARPGDVAVTSGEATGEPPTVRKVGRLRLLLDDRIPLGVASGLTPENVGTYLPYATHFLVSTGISADFYNFDADKTRAFVEAVRGAS